jgi:hypothetical protein
MILVMLLFAVEEFRIERLRKKKKKRTPIPYFVKRTNAYTKKKKLNA